MLTTWTAYGRIGRPLETHNARSPEEYRSLQVRNVAQLQAARPAHGPRTAHAAKTEPVVGPFVNGGRWAVLCPCGNLVSYDPEWQLGCCFDCGATYEVPPPADWQAAETVLMARPRMANRNWFPAGGLGHPVETVEDLVRENTAHALSDR
jgi:hypothetical protein